MFVYLASLQEPLRYYTIGVGVMVKTMACGIVVSEFEFQSSYCFHFGTKTLGKGMNSLILSARG